MDKLIYLVVIVVIAVVAYLLYETTYLEPTDNISACLEFETEQAMSECLDKQITDAQRKVELIDALSK